VTRRRVKAKDVLLKTAARMEKVAVTLPNKPIRGRFAGSMSHTCLPRPSETLTLTQHIDMSRKTLKSHSAAQTRRSKEGAHTHETIKI
jgi:hypothetical protein